LSKSAVDGQALGLNGTKASGAVGTDIGNGGATTVANILAANGTTLGTPDANTSFTFTGANFSGTAGATNEGSVTLKVNLSGVNDTASLVNAINTAIGLATTTATGVSTGSPLAAAGIVASVNTDATGKQQLTFSSGTAAFQVQAGDQTANALLGNFNPTAANTATGQVTSSTTTTAVTTAGNLGAGTVLRVQGSGIGGATATPIDLTDIGGLTAAAAVTSLESGADSVTLAAAGIAVTGAVGGKLTFTSATGGSVNLSTSGDSANLLGLGSFSSGVGATTFADVNATGVVGTLPGAPSGSTLGETLQVSVAGGSSINLSSGALLGVGVGADAALAVTAFNKAIAANTTLTAAGLQATTTAGGTITIKSSNGTSFRVQGTTIAGDGTTAAGGVDLGFGNTNAGTGTASTESVLATNSSVASQGASATAAYAYNPTANQSVGFTAYDASGAAHSLSVSLVNNTLSAGSTNNAQTIDQAIASINNQLQGSGDATLSTIVAVKSNVVGGTLANPIDTQGIKFISSLASFNVNLGAEGTATSQQGIGTAAQQGTTQVSGPGNQSDISTSAGAATAVNVLTAAVTALGSAQANVGKGENLLNYAVALATTQVTNEAAAESRIRDADLAAQAANLSKAQILVQAGTAALSQANSAPQAILSLLK
jgi:flagellin